MLPHPREDPSPVPFSISGVSLGYLQFEINPSTYNPFPEKNYTVHPVISGTPSTFNHLYDNSIYTMNFDSLTGNFYQALKRYSELDTTLNVAQSKFTDGNIGAFVYAPVKVLRVVGQPRTGLVGSGIDYVDVLVEFVRDV